MTAEPGLDPAKRGQGGEGGWGVTGPSEALVTARTDLLGQTPKEVTSGLKHELSETSGLVPLCCLGRTNSETSSEDVKRPRVTRNAGCQGPQPTRGPLTQTALRG